MFSLNPTYQSILLKSTKKQKLDLEALMILQILRILEDLMKVSPQQAKNELILLKNNNKTLKGQISIEERIF